MTFRVTALRPSTNHHGLLLPAMGNARVSRAVLLGGRISQMIRRNDIRHEDGEVDSGWEFLSGRGAATATLSIEEVVRFDSSVAPYLLALPGQRFTRVRGSDIFVVDRLPVPVMGMQFLHDISISLPIPFERRDEGSLTVFSTEGITLSCELSSGGSGEWQRTTIHREGDVWVRSWGLVLERQTLMFTAYLEERELEAIVQAIVDSVRD